MEGLLQELLGHIVKLPKEMNAQLASLSTQQDSMVTDELLRKNFRNKLASRDLEVIEFDIAVDEVTAGPDHHGVALAALILRKQCHSSIRSGR